MTIKQSCIVALENLIQLYFQKLRDVAGELQKFICNIRSSRHVLRETLFGWIKNPDRMQKKPAKKVSIN